MKITKSFTLFILTVIVSVKLQAQTSNAKVAVTNIPTQKGILIVGWYNKADDYRNPDKAVFKQKVKINNQAFANLVFTNIPFGDYAISLYFDENENGKLDKNFLGIPKESYGFSNNIYHATKATSFEEAKFNLKQNNQIIAIKLK